MMGMMRSKEPWSIFQLKFFYQMSPLLPEPCNLVAFSPQEFPNVIFLDRYKDYGLERGSDFPSQPATTGKARTKTQVSWRGSLLFTQHPAVSHPVEGGEVEALVLNNLQPLSSPN